MEQPNPRSAQRQTDPVKQPTRARFSVQQARMLPLANHRPNGRAYSHEAAPEEKILFTSFSSSFQLQLSSVHFLFALSQSSGPLCCGSRKISLIVASACPTASKEPATRTMRSSSVSFFSTLIFAPH